MKVWFAGVRVPKTYPMASGAPGVTQRVIGVHPFRIASTSISRTVPPGHTLTITRPTIGRSGALCEKAMVGTIRVAATTITA